MKLRLAALEKKSAEDGLALTEAQVQALEKKKLDDEASGEIETAHPGYPGSQDTFYVGTIKGAGRVCQQTFVDTYSKVACAKLYTTKTPVTAADLLNDKVLPLFAAHNMGIIRMLTDRGTEYCGKVETHDYELYPGGSGIEHTKTKARHPQKQKRLVEGLQGGQISQTHKTWAENHSLEKIGDSGAGCQNGRN